jgi:hypothetical protein
MKGRSDSSGGDGGGKYRAMDDDQNKVVTKWFLSMVALMFRWYSTVLGAFSVAALMGVAYYGWIVDEQSYTDAMAALAADRPSLIGWVVQQYQSVIGLV